MYKRIHVFVFVFYTYLTFPNCIYKLAHTTLKKTKKKLHVENISNNTMQKIVDIKTE